MTEVEDRSSSKASQREVTFLPVHRCNDNSIPTDIIRAELGWEVEAFNKEIL